LKTPNKNKFVTGLFILLVLVTVAGAAMVSAAGEISSFSVTPSPIKLGSPASINYSLAVPGKITIKLLNETGTEELRTILNNVSKTAGPNTQSWDGKDSTSSLVLDGDYIIRIEFRNSSDVLVETLEKPVTAYSVPKISLVSVSPISTSYFDPVKYPGQQAKVTYNITSNITSTSNITVTVLKGTVPIKTTTVTNQPAGTWDATWDGKDSAGLNYVADGPYIIKVDAVNPNWSAFMSTISTTVTLDKDNPIISGFTATGAVLRFGTSVTFKANLNEKAYVTINIRDSAGEIKKKIIDNVVKMPGVVSASWDGKAGSSLVNVLEGSYTADISAVDVAGKPAAQVPAVSFVTAYMPVVTGLPVATTTTKIPDFNPDDGPITVNYNLSNIAGAFAESLVTVQILKGTVIVKEFPTVTLSTGAQTIEWDGKNAGIALPDATYTIQVTAVSKQTPTLKAIAKGYVDIEAAAPVISGLILTPNPLKLGTTMSARFSISENCKVSMSVYKGITLISEVVKDLPRTATAPVALTWNGKVGLPLADIPEGEYTIKVKAVDNYNNPVEDSRNIKVAYFPVITLPTVVPTFDPLGTNEPIYISFSVSCKAKVMVNILSGTTVIRSVYNVIAGPGELSFEWDGKNSSNLFVPDGKYTYQVTAESEVISTFKSIAQGTINLESRNPSVTNISVTPYPVKLNAAATFKYSLSEPAKVEFTILDVSTGRLVRTLTTDNKTAPGIYTKAWDGKEGTYFVPAGNYRLVIKATDNSQISCTVEFPFTVLAPNVITPVLITGSATPATIDVDSLQYVNISYSVSADSAVNVLVLDSALKNYKVIYSSKTILANTPEVLTWNGLGGIPSGIRPGKYTIRIDALPKDLTKFSKTSKSISVVNLTGYGTTCTACHANYPVAHQQSTKNNCALCHRSDKPVYRIDKQADCYASGCHSVQRSTHFTTIETATSHYPSSWNSTYCLGCHSKVNPYGVKKVHTGLPNHVLNVYTVVTSENGSCSYCHPSKDMETIHVGVVNKKTGLVMTCNSCHGAIGTNSTPGVDPIVNTVIKALTPPADCAACHKVTSTVQPGLKPVHAAATHAPADFTTTAYTETDKTTCKECHISKNLVAIHTGTATHTGNTMNCDTCHSATVAVNVKAAVDAKNDNCSACHTLSTHFDKRAATVTQHSSTFLLNPEGDCSVCHIGGSDSLPSEHSKPSSSIDATGTPITCDTCHGSTDPKVQTAITANNKMCNACHTYPPTLHNPTHAVNVYTTDPTRTENCAVCHASKNLETLHVNVLNKKTNIVMNCGSCHAANADPFVRAAIVAGVTNECAACHKANATTVGLKPVHAAATHAPADYTTTAYTATDKGTCWLCHPTKRIDLIHTGTATHTGKTMNCDTCHGATAAANVKAAITAKDDNCSACHNLSTHFNKQTATATQHSSTFVVNPDVECASCHFGGSDSLPKEHFKTTSTVNGTTTKITCDTCHLSTNQAVVNAISANNTKCDACHTYPPTLHNPIHTTNVYTIDTATNGTCASCHASKSLTTLHVNVLNKKTNQTMTCNSCHGLNADSIVKTAISTGVASNECATCHKTGATQAGLKPVHSSVVHAPADFTTTAYTVTDKTTCKECHTTKRLDLLHTGTAVHSGKTMNCDTCHGATAATNVKAAVTAKNDNCNACHDLNTHFDKRVRTVTQHSSTFMAVQEIACSACHIGGSDSLPLEHFKSTSTVNGGPGPFTCDSCHGSTDTRVQTAIKYNYTSCDSCHDYPPALHQPIHTVNVFNTDPNRTENCASCHTTKDIKVIHYNVLNKKTNKVMTCNSCHGPASDPIVKAAITAGVASNECATCHKIGATQAGLKAVHADIGIAHTGPALATTPTNCAKCHTKVVSDEHSNKSVMTHNATLNCNSCHSSALAKVKASITSPVTDGSNLACAYCHTGATGGVHAVHTNVFAPHITGIFPTATDAQCLACHTTVAPAFASTNEGLHAVNGLAAKTSAYGAYLTFEGTIWTSKSAMKCTSCHGTNATANILKAPFSANTGNGSTYANDLCFKCHDRATYASGSGRNTGFRTSSSGTNLHTIGEHQVPCVDCHTYAPHGGGWRLLGTTANTTAPFASHAKNIRIDRKTNAYSLNSCAANCDEHPSH
jgi:flagellar hook assembly protein FlgD